MATPYGLTWLLTHPAVDWGEVRATPPGRPSPLARHTPVEDRP